MIYDFFSQSVLSNLPKCLTETGLGTPPSHKGHCCSWNNSVDAEILEPESGKWKKGKIRMRVILEFCPDEPQEINNNILQQDSNSLDDIRIKMAGYRLRVYRCYPNKQMKQVVIYLKLR